MTRKEKPRKSGNCGCVIVPTGILYCAPHLAAYDLLAAAKACSDALFVAKNEECEWLRNLRAAISKAEGK